MKIVLLCGVDCSDRSICLEKQKNILNNPAIIDETTTFEEITEYFTNSRDIIWNEPNLYPESREQKLSIVPKGYHKTAIYFKPSKEEMIEKNLLEQNMQFVAPTEFENLDCIMRYV